ncbi:UNVERIFIED_CONTAM: hypothetical protein GTU68_020950, partial [Idotea baltica]|nr:hypothetical protein [Idotea baltica]
MTTLIEQKSEVYAHGLIIDQGLYKLVESELTPDTGISHEAFWESFTSIIADLAPKNKTLLAKRDKFQLQLDNWFKAQPKGNPDIAAQKKFLEEIGYLLPEGGDFSVEVTNVDPEIATIAGPQLVVPVQNARFALNAANARWGSLYDALYGTDVIGNEDGAEAGQGFNPKRGSKVIAYAKAFLDESVPLASGSYADVTQLKIDNGQFVATLNGSDVSLKDVGQFVGYLGEATSPTSLLLKNHGLHIEIQIDGTSPIGKTDSADIKDVILESAVTTIQDFEDSVAVVDAADKIVVYRNWLGLIMGNLEESFEKGGKTVTRRLNSDKTFTAKDGSELILPGRSVLFARNVGIHMYTDAVKTAEGEEIPEGFLDAMVTALVSMRDVRATNELRNSRSGSIYIVKPKQHGPEEVAFTCELFSRVEQALGLEENTIKIGIMDEERRTTINLKECV